MFFLELIYNSYSTATINGNNNIGGIAGYLHHNSFSSIENTVALNINVNTIDVNIARIWGRVITRYSAHNNHARSDMLINGEPLPAGEGEHDNQHGADVAPEVFHNIDFWIDTMGWDFDEIWTWNYETNLPTLRVFQHDNL